jgi:hypothetical protein
MGNKKVTAHIHNLEHGVPERLFYLRVRGLNLHTLPAEAPFDAKIPARHARVEAKSCERSGRPAGVR